MQLNLPLGPVEVPTKAACVATPTGYSGLYAFHKYWGKKPHELLSYLIRALSKPDDVVLDPFMGSGTSGREAMLQRRRFIGIDLNPVAVELTRLLLSPPSGDLLRRTSSDISRSVSREIHSSYRLHDGEIGSHFLWNGRTLERVWSTCRRRRLEHTPTTHDENLSGQFSEYISRHVRQPRFFDNPRINASSRMTLSSILTGRAQRNLDMLLDAIGSAPMEVRAALRLCLTASSGQMSRMVFAVSNRGKTKGIESDRVEVGSWVIGYWRPLRHFEINAWNCFDNRVTRLVRALAQDDLLARTPVASDANDVLQRVKPACLIAGDCRKHLHKLPSSSVDLVITDPPHSDRIPYLELSEYWNAILGSSPPFEDEIVISNAKTRGKGKADYIQAMSDVFWEVARVLNPSGCFVLVFNSRHRDEWRAFHAAGLFGDSDLSLLKYYGYFPHAYSATSVVQDNRKGSLKSDVALVFGRTPLHCIDPSRAQSLRRLNGWREQLPPELIG